MSPRGRFTLWLAVSYASLLALIGAAAAAVIAGQGAEDQALLRRLLEERVPVLAFLAALLFALVGGVVRALIARHVSPYRVLAEQTRLVLANPAYRVAGAATRDQADLAAEVNRLADAYQQLRNDLDCRVARAGAELAGERNRLAALMSELAEGVLVCNTGGRILLYNEQARALLAPGAVAPGQALVGLGRSVFAFIDRQQVLHVLEILGRQHRPGEAFAGTRFVSPTAAGRLLKVRAAPLMDSDAMLVGIVFALEDVTAFLEQERSRAALLQALTEAMRASLAHVRAAAENLGAFPGMEPARREQFVAIVADESRDMSDRLNRALRDYADALKEHLALEDMRVADLFELARRRIGSAPGVAVRLDALDDELWIRVDSFALVQALAFLAARLHEECAVSELSLSARAAGGHAELDIGWGAAIVDSEALSRWEIEPMRIGAEHTALTLRDVLEHHGGEIWIHRSDPGVGRGAHLRLLLPAGEAGFAPARVPVAPTDSRPEFYDFDLFRDSSLTPALQERRLQDLSYTAFDTETTGLEPSAGDEIISIGAVRIVNGRLLRNEVFEQLVNPRRALNPESTRIHGITAEVLDGQPTIERVLPAFHRFCDDTVLVAHNAAFDMRFLEMKEAGTGVRFTQPVLDTLLLSALVHPSQQDHGLEAIADRLGVPVIGRHTALGDALLTGEIFRKFLPLLEEHGIGTLTEALQASRQTYHARLRY